LHGGDSFGYRFEKDGKSVVYSTDSEHKLENRTEAEAFAAFFRDADVVVFDPQRIADRATFAEPLQRSVGIVAVYTAIMCCLQRCTKTWTPLRTNVAVALIGLGAICKNYRYIIIDPVLKNNVYNNGGILFLTGFSWMIVWVLLSFASYAAEWRAKRRNGGGAEGRDSLQEQLGRLDDFYINIVPGGHMVALLVNCCVDIKYFWATLSSVPDEVFM
jgi:hypothetical protein